MDNNIEAPNLLPKELLRAGKERLPGDTELQATSVEVEELRREMSWKSRDFRRRG
ncbi:MAG: hypothetical protein ACR2PA_21835 [Hyphomicrobiaceae bacterium]